MKSTICALIVACLAGALPAEKVDVLVIPGGSAKKTSDRTAKAFAKYFGEVADSLSLTTNAVEEAKLPDDLRAAADAVVLGFNATVAPATLKKLRAFVKDGGRLLVACRLPKGVDEIMGLKQTGTITQRDALDPELAGILPVEGKLPPAAKYAAFTRWAEYTAPIVELAGSGEVAAYWAKEGGAKRAEPAVVTTPAGVFVSYLWFRGGSPAQRDLLEGVFRALLPGKAIVRKPDPTWRAATPAPVPPNEHRGVWSHARGLFASGKNWDESCALLKDRGTTDLYMLSAWAGAAFYESDVIRVLAPGPVRGQGARRTRAGGGPPASRKERYVAGLVLPLRPGEPEEDGRHRLRNRNTWRGRHPSGLHPFPRHAVLLLSALPPPLRGTPRQEGGEVAGGCAMGRPPLGRMARLSRGPGLKDGGGGLAPRTPSGTRAQAG